jgi:hypothetical protein
MFGQPDTTMGAAPALDPSVGMPMPIVDDAVMADTQQPVMPAADPVAATASAYDDPMPTAAPTAAADPMTVPQAPVAADTDGLLAIKQDALTSLSPLVGQLEQTPEEKFKTTMMMIQASDDASLVKVAYEAAQSIQDEKTRAQALLDVVNEINYFTSHTNG